MATVENNRITFEESDYRADKVVPTTVGSKTYDLVPFKLVYSFIDNASGETVTLDSNINYFNKCSKDFDHKVVANRETAYAGAGTDTVYFVND